LDANTAPKRFLKSPPGTNPLKLIEFSFNKNNYSDYDEPHWVNSSFPPHPDLNAAGNATVLHDYGAYSCAPCGRPVFTAVSCIDDPNVPGGYIIRVKQHLMPAGSYAETSSGPAPIPEAGIYVYDRRILYEVVGSYFFRSHRRYRQYAQELSDGRWGAFGAADG